ncbi:MAG: hypothetical protein ACJ797_06205 [Ktedonobacteraceae bacterium]
MAARTADAVAAEVRAALLVGATSMPCVMTLGKDRADAAQTEDAANGRGSDGFEGLAA